MGDPNSPVSPDDMLLKDLNPCLTPYYAKSRSKVWIHKHCLSSSQMTARHKFINFDREVDILQEFEEMGYESPQKETLSEDKVEFGFNSFERKLSKSSDYCHNSKSGSTISRPARRSNETKFRYGKQMHHKLY